MMAVIMAGGEGSRLKPLTCNMPKPMAHLCGRPILEYILDLLDENGFDEARLTLRYLPQCITEHFSSEYYKNIRLYFVEETTPLGTAGGVKNAAGDSEDDLLVISGDAICDFDLKAAMLFHKEHNADATIIVKHVEDPREYGLVNMDENSKRVAGFVEKPCFAQAICDLANTGVYILSRTAVNMIPQGVSFDFAKDLFPQMLKNNQKILGLEEQGYWCDIGDLNSLRRCARDILQKKVRCTLNGTEIEGVVYKNPSEAGRSAVNAPAYIGAGVTIGKNCRIGEGSMLDDGVSVGDRTVIEGSIIGINACIGSDVHMKGCVVCGGAVVENGVRLFEGSAVGGRAVIGSRATVEPNVKIWPMKYVKNNTIQREHLRLGALKRELFDDDGICIESPGEMTPAMCARLGAAVGTVLKRGIIGTASEGGAAEALKDALISGIRQTGCSVWDFGECIEPQGVFCFVHCDLPLGIYVTAGSIRMVSDCGLTLPRELERDIELCMVRAESKSVAFEDYGKRISMAAISGLYQNHLVKSCENSLTGLSAAVICGNAAVKKLLYSVLDALGCKVSSSGTIKLTLSDSGRELSAADNSGTRLEDERVMVLIAENELRRGRNIAVRFDAPHIIDTLAKEHGKTAMRYLSCPADTSDGDARALAKMQPWVRDGLLRAIMLLSVIKSSKKGLNELNTSVPQFSDAAKTIVLSANPCEVMRKISRTTPAQSGIGEGIMLPYKNGTVLVRPLKRGGGIKIIAEAQNFEIAKELCSGFEDMINKL